MNVQNKLFIIYTIIAICLLLIQWFSIFNKKYNLKNLLNKHNYFVSSLLIFLILFLIIFSLFICFVICNGLAKIFVNDNQFFMIQLLTNIPNYFIIYVYIVNIKAK